MIIKLLKLIFILMVCYPIYGISFLIPRKRRRWVFGLGNYFFDNSKYLYFEASQKNIEAIWLTSSKELSLQLKLKGINSHYLYSIRGCFYLLTSNVYIYSYLTNKHLPIWFIGKAKYINLWHGVGIKNIYFGNSKDPISSTLRSPIKKNIYKLFKPELYKKPDIFISTSPFMTKHFMRCLNLNSYHILEAKYPRNNILDIPNKEVMEVIKIQEDTDSFKIIKTIKKYKECYLYMPTWRPNKSKFLIESDFNFTLLNEVMIKKNALLILKLHPETPLIDLRSQTNIIILDSSTDIYPILPFTDCLITDYSSIYYDYILLKNKSVIFFLFDYEDYINNNQDLIMDFDQATEGAKAYNFNELIEILKMHLPLPINKEKKEQIMKLFWGEESDKKNIIKEIKKLDK